MSNQEDDNYYKPARLGNFQSNNYVEYEGNGDRNNTLPTEEYLNKIRLYLKDIINDLKKFDTWPIQLIIAINFVSHRETDKENMMHSKSNDI